MDEFWQRAVRDPAAGEIRDGETRYVMFRVDVITTLISKLDKPVREAVLASFEDAVYERGGQSLAGYFVAAGRDQDLVLNTLSSTAPALGWGAWRFVKEDAALRLIVDNSPFATFAGNDGVPACAPIVGMMRALVEIAFPNLTSVHETSCCGAGHSHCEFIAR